MLTLERLKELLSYNPETGIFTHLTKVTPRNIGDKAGYLDSASGYWRLTIDGTQYQAHRIAFFYVVGRMPDYPREEIDHRDRNKSNNEWENLRLATKGQNRQNIPAYANNKSGYKGVSQIASGRWIAQIKVNKQYFKFGPFDSPEEASLAYDDAKLRLHKFQPEL